MSNQRRPKKISRSVLHLLLLLILGGSIWGYLSLIQKVHVNIKEQQVSVSTGLQIQQLNDRIHYLETKIDSYLAYGRDPFLSIKESAKCNEPMPIKKIACPDPDKNCAIDSSSICMDDMPFTLQSSNDALKEKGKRCIVYDFGIRESPEFGLAFAKQCEVVGFDPSPISIKWWQQNQQKIKTEYPNYTFMGVGAGGIDGQIKLREYNWGQVSIIQLPYRVIDTSRCGDDGKCKYTFHEMQKTFDIPVRTMKSIMEELNHNRVHLLKLDVEGSEYSFLEKMIDDLSCRKVDQLTLEWHHYSYDVRYGVTSNPEINVLVALLKERCGLELYWVHGSHGWPSNEKVYAEMGMTLYYNIGSFKRTKWF